METTPPTVKIQSAEGEGPQHPLRRSVWAIANLMRAAGLSTLDTIEHLTLLLFLQLVHENQADDLADVSEIAARLRADVSLSACAAARDPAAHFNEHVFPAFQAGVEEAVPSGDPLRALVEGFHPKIEDGPLFGQVLELAAGLHIDPQQRDINGAIYEQLVATLSEAGHLGQYFTPRHIVETMVQLVDPRPGESIYDPAAGTGGFLLGAASRELNQGGDASGLDLHGRELNRTVRRLCVMNLLTHELSPRRILGGDTLAPSNQVRNTYDVVLTNPPFSGIVASNGTPRVFPIDTRTSEALFLQHVVASLRPGGRAAVVCPEGLLANLGAEQQLRRHVMAEARVEAVASLPPGVFNPYTSVRTGILLLTKGQPTKRVWFFDVRADGFDLDMRRRPNGRNDLPDLLRRFPAKETGPQSIEVDSEDLAEDNYRLVASRYLRALKPTTSALVRPLGDVCVLRKATVRPSEFFPDEQFFYVALEHVEAETGRLAPPDPTPGREIRSTKSRFLAGDVLYGKLRPYLAKVICLRQEGICSTEFLVLQPTHDAVLGDFLAEVLRSPTVTEEATALMVGANHPRIHPKDLLGIRIPVPPLAEQKRLVGEISLVQERIEDAKREISRRRDDLRARVSALWD